MPDWNPAEMIGRVPRALAYSLYEELITNGPWLTGRSSMGYHLPPANKLMFSFDVSFWFIIGILGQILFGGRFIVQWIYSEYKKESVFPVSFWYLSLLGSALLLAYSIHIQDIIFTAGFSLNMLIYIRNLMLRKKK